MAMLKKICRHKCELWIVA